MKKFFLPVFVEMERGKENTKKENKKKNSTIAANTVIYSDCVHFFSFMFVLSFFNFEF